MDELCEEWEPEPLYPSLPPEQAAWKEPVISSQVGKQASTRAAHRRWQLSAGPCWGRAAGRQMLSRSELAGADCRLSEALGFQPPCGPAACPAPPQVVVNGKQALNFASLNFLGIAGLEDVSCREGFGRRARLRATAQAGEHAGRRPGSSSSHGVLAWPAWDMLTSSLCCALSIVAAVLAPGPACAAFAADHGVMPGHHPQVRRGVLRAARLLRHHRCAPAAGGGHAAPARCACCIASVLPCDSCNFGT